MKFFSRKYFGSSAVKESLDNLPMGVCFANNKGMVLLLNRRMSAISYAITGKELQDSQLFWKLVTQGDLREGVRRITYGSNPVIELRDKTVWSFSNRQLMMKHKPVTQILASEITELDRARIELADANERLKEMNQRLRQYGKDVSQITAREERLNTKIRIHDELGSALAATRHFLVSDGADGSEDKIIDKWKMAVSILRGSAQAQHRNDISFIKNAADILGVLLEIDGEFPRDNTVRKLLITVMSEALNNSVRHAGAKRLRVVITEDSENIIARYINDGNIPAGDITEAGGLTQIRRSIESLGGTMKTTVSDVFTLTVTIPKGWEDIK